MTKLTTYTVTFRTDLNYATEDITAPCPEAALKRARAIADDRARVADLDFQPYTDDVPVEDIIVNTPDGDRVAEWLSPDLLLRLAAEDLFNALEKALTALNTAPRFRVPRLDTDSYAIATACGRAIAKAKGEGNSGGT
jgi:hypothetical protein